MGRCNDAGDTYPRGIGIMVHAHTHTHTHSLIASFNADSPNFPPHLAKVSWVSHHVDVEQLGYVPGSGIIVVSLEGGSDVGTFLVDEVPLILGSLAGSDAPDQVTNAQS